MAPHAVWIVPGFSPGFTVIDAAQPGPATLTPYEFAPGYQSSSCPPLTVPGTLNPTVAVPPCAIVPVARIESVDSLPAAPTRITPGPPRLLSPCS